MTHDEIMTALAKRVDIVRAYLYAIECEAHALKAGSLGDRYKGKYGYARAHDAAVGFYAESVTEALATPDVPFSPADALFHRRYAIAFSIAWYVRNEQATDAARENPQAKASDTKACLRCEGSAPVARVVSLCDACIELVKASPR